MESDLSRVVSQSWEGFGDLDVPSRLLANGEVLENWGNYANSKFQAHKRELESLTQRLQHSVRVSDGVAYRDPGGS